MQERKKSYGGFSVLRSVISACCGYLLCVGLLFVSAYVIYQGIISEQWTEIFSFLAVVISALFSTFFGAGKGGQRIVGSLCTGILLCLMFWLTGMVFGGAFNGMCALAITIIVLLECVISAVLSGLVER